MENLIKALQIFLKYGNPKYPTSCSHDQLWINSQIDPSKVSEEDIEELRVLGFRIEDDCFISTKFGSC